MRGDTERPGDGAGAKKPGGDAGSVQAAGDPMQLLLSIEEGGQRPVRVLRPEVARRGAAPLRARALRGGTLGVVFFAAWCAAAYAGGAGGYFLLLAAAAAVLIQRLRQGLRLTYLLLRFPVVEMTPLRAVADTLVVAWPLAAWLTFAAVWNLTGGWRVSELTDLLAFLLQSGLVVYTALIVPAAIAKQELGVGHGAAGVVARQLASTHRPARLAAQRVRDRGLAGLAGVVSQDYRLPRPAGRGCALVVGPVLVAPFLFGVSYAAAAMAAAGLRAVFGLGYVAWGWMYYLTVGGAHFLACAALAAIIDHLTIGLGIATLHEQAQLEAERGPAETPVSTR